MLVVRSGFAVFSALLLLSSFSSAFWTDKLEKGVSAYRDGRYLEADVYTYPYNDTGCETKHELKEVIRGGACHTLLNSAQTLWYKHHSDGSTWPWLRWQWDEEQDTCRVVFHSLPFCEGHYWSPGQFMATSHQCYMPVGDLAGNVVWSVSVLCGDNEEPVNSRYVDHYLSYMQDDFRQFGWANTTHPP